MTTYPCSWSRLPANRPAADKGIVLLVVIFLLLLFIFGGTPGLADNLSRIMHTPYFTVHYDPSKPYLAESVADSANSEYIRISRDLGYTPSRGHPFPLYVYITHYAFIQAGGLSDRFTVGTAASGSETISVDGSGAFVSIQEVLAHEITHAVVFRILGPNVASLPLWINEGLAKYESESYFQDDDTLVANAAANGALISFSSMQTSFPKDRTDLAYAQSASAVRFLVKKYGKSAPRKLLETLAETGSLDKAMFRATNKTSDEFQDEWLNRVSRNYRFLRIGRILGAIGGVFMALLAVAAYLVRRKQKIEAAKQWEWEEFEENMRKQLGNDWWR